MEVQIPLLADILIVLGVSIVILLLSHRLGIPPVVGLLVTGVVAGPHGLGLVHAPHEVEVLAEIGVVLLLFTIGIEFSLTKIFEIKRFVLLGGTLQVALTTGATYLVATFLGLPFGTALFIGFLVSLSSTAIVLQTLQERAEIESPHGRMALAVLIFQDMAIVPMMIVTPILGGGDDVEMLAIAILIGKAAAVVALAYVASRFVVPWFLFQIARTRSRELFVLSVVMICFAVAWLTANAGLSLGLGAFLAGLIISESEYSHQAMGGILPFRDVFTSLFFVSIGMLLDLQFLARQPLLIGFVVISVFILKSVTGAIVPLVLGLPLRTMIVAGIALSQIGEFSFVLAKAGVQFNLLGDDLYQMFLAVSVLSMAATPFLLALAPRVAAAASKVPALRRLEERSHQIDDSVAEMSGHLIIIGYGVGGKTLALAARNGNIPHLVIEANPETVRRERRNQEKIIYGDASYQAVLDHAGVARAQAIAVVINDPIATREVIQRVRMINETAYIIVRTRFVREISTLMALGASEVITEELEASVEIITRVMAKYLVPADQIERFSEVLRGENFRLAKPKADTPPTVEDLLAIRPDLELEMTRVTKGAPLVGQTLAELDLRNRFGVTLLEVRRGEDTYTNPASDLRILEDDVVVVIGSERDRDRFARACVEGEGRG